MSGGWLAPPTGGKRAAYVTPFGTRTWSDFQARETTRARSWDKVKLSEERQRQWSARTVGTVARSAESRCATCGRALTDAAESRCEHCREACGPGCWCRESVWRHAARQCKGVHSSECWALNDRAVVRDEGERYRAARTRRETGDRECTLCRRRLPAWAFDGRADRPGGKRRECSQCRCKKCKAECWCKSGEQTPLWDSVREAWPKWEPDEVYARRGDVHAAWDELAGEGERWREFVEWRDGKRYLPRCPNGCRKPHGGRWTHVRADRVADEVTGGDPAEHEGDADWDARVRAALRWAEAFDASQETRRYERWLLDDSAKRREAFWRLFFANVRTAHEWRRRREGVEWVAGSK